MNESLIFDEYFDGEKNFFTPNVTGYATIKGSGDEVVVFEKSEGTGLFDSPLFGCSALLFNTKTNEIGRIELSKAFGTKKEAEDYINSITIENINNAERYGEIKTLGSGEQ